MNFTIETVLICGLLIMVYELFVVAVAYFMRDKLKKSINMFLGRQTEYFSSSALATEEQLSAQKRLVASKLTDLSNSVRNALRETNEQVEANSGAIKKLKTTKANSSAVKKLVSEQSKKNNKSVRVTQTGRKPKSSRKGR